MWLLMAIGSAFFAGVTAILAKCGIKKTDSDVATALRTAVVLAFSLLMVGIVGSFPAVFSIGGKNLLFLILSGLSTGASWLCYFKALSIGDVNKVTPVDKSSTVLTILLALVFFERGQSVLLKLICTAALAVGIFLMIEKKQVKDEKQPGRGWFPFAACSAVFAALTSILAKVGIDGVESNLGTAVRTLVVLVMAWFIVFFKGKQTKIKEIDKFELLFILLSGVTTGASWLCYYYAIQNGVVSVVVPIDKLSILVSIFFSYIIFKEKLTKKAAVGLTLMTAATLIMAIFIK